MNSETYKSTLNAKIKDCAGKYEYYKSFTDTVTAALWKGKKEAYEDVLKTIDEINFYEETKDAKTNGRKVRTGCTT